MKAICTRYLGPTNSHGSRIKADDGDSNSITISYPHEQRMGSDAHAQAAIALCQKMAWDGTLISGATKDGYVFVFSNSDFYSVVITQGQRDAARKAHGETTRCHLQLLIPPSPACAVPGPGCSARLRRRPAARAVTATGGMNHGRKDEMHTHCDMKATCTKPVAYLDDRGFVYCTEHGLQRQDYSRCRKLRPHELNRLKQGMSIDHY